MGGQRILTNDQVNEPYYHQLQRHIEQVRAALLTPEATPSRDDENDENTFDDTLLYPAAYWTAHEKELFFHALKSHSRLRPDLISACIKTKNVVEVSAYMEALETAADELDEEEADEEEDNDKLGEQEVTKALGGEEGEEEDVVLDDVAAERRVRPQGRRDVAHGWAMEMSEDWVEFEENQAELLTLEEQAQMDARYMDTDSNSNSNSRSSSTSSSDGPELLTAGRNFTSADLEAMESLLREAEDGSTELKVVPDEMKAKYQMPREEISSRSASPSRLASARDNANRPSPSTPEPSLNQIPATPDRSGMQVREEEKGEGKGGEGGEGGRAKEGHHDASEESEDEIPVDLSPASRRRLQKRLYMRRQRALKAGREADLTSVKLRPGRKTKLRRPRKKKQKLASGRPPPSPSTSSSSSNSDDDVEMGDNETNSAPPDEEEYARGGKGGLTAYSKAKQQLLQSGIDGERLQEEGIGFFHLTALSKLIKILNSGYRENYSTSSVLSLMDGKEPVISADVIHLLTGITVEFVAEVVHRALAIGEQQVYYKRNTKVWRAPDNDNLSVDSIKLALEMTGLNLRSRHQFVADMLEDTEDDPEDEGENPVPAKGSSVFPLVSEVHWELHEPHVYLPLAYRPGSGRDGKNDGIVVEDEYELQKELKEEEELDNKDMLASREYEVELWEEIYQ